MNQIFDTEFQGHNRIAASLVAKAVSTICPGVYPISGRAEPSGFSYDFVFTHTFSKDAFPVIEECLKRWIKEALEIEVLEMVPENGAQFFRHHKRHYPAVLASESETPLISVLKMGDFIDIGGETPVRSTSELGVIKLLKVEARPPIIYRNKETAVTRITGVACKDRKHLKEYLKEKEIYWNLDHRTLGQELGLFKLSKKRGKGVEETAVCGWKGKGEQLLFDLFSLWRRCYMERDFELSIGPSTSKRTATFHWGTSKGDVDPYLGLYKPKDPIQGIGMIKCSLNSIVKELISSLKFITKIPKIFGLNAEISFVFRDKECKHLFEEAFQSLGECPVSVNQGRQTKLTLLIEDCFGRKWHGPSIELTISGSEYELKESLFGGVQSFVATVLESGEKDLSQKKHILSRVKELKFE